MRFGLFGKLQAKRDFIALGVPRNFLNVWEPWLQAGISASRMQLDDSWQKAFLTAPIWRFWLGADICGVTVVGGIMPSMDGVGRYFPLTALCFSEAGEEIPPPELNTADAWFAALEDFMFMTLDTDKTYEAISAAIYDLKPIESRVLLDTDGKSLITGFSALAQQGFGQAFTQARLANFQAIYRCMSFWWTAGGEEYAPRVLACHRLPEPHLYVKMLTGHFDHSNVTRTNNDDE